MYGEKKKCRYGSVRRPRDEPRKEGGHGKETCHRAGGEKADRIMDPLCEKEGDAKQIDVRSGRGKPFLERKNNLERDVNLVSRRKSNSVGSRVAAVLKKKGKDTGRGEASPFPIKKVD